MIYMKKNERNQLELPILTEVSIGTIHSNTRSVQHTAQPSTCESEYVELAGSEDIEIYQSISNAYFRALSTQKR